MVENSSNHIPGTPATSALSHRTSTSCGGYTESLLFYWCSSCYCVRIGCRLISVPTVSAISYGYIMKHLHTDLININFSYFSFLGCENAEVSSRLYFPPLGNHEQLNLYLIRFLQCMKYSFTKNNNLSMILCEKHLFNSWDLDLLVSYSDIFKRKNVRKSIEETAHKSLSTCIQLWCTWKPGC